MGGVGPAQFPSDDIPSRMGQGGRATEKLKELEEARASGALSEEEFEDQKARLLQEEHPQEAE